MNTIEAAEEIADVDLELEEGSGARAETGAHAACSATTSGSTCSSIRPGSKHPGRADRAPVRRAARRRAPAVSGVRFEVYYQVDRVIRATSIQDVLRQVSTMGATEVTTITRLD